MEITPVPEPRHTIGASSIISGTCFLVHTTRAVGAHIAHLPELAEDADNGLVIPTGLC